MLQARTFVHIVCLGTIGACFGVSFTLLQGQPLMQQLVVGAGFWLWGRFAFAPSRAASKTGAPRGFARPPQTTGVRRYRYDDHVAYDQGIREHPNNVLVRLAPDAHAIVHLPLVHAWIFEAQPLPHPLPPYIVDLSSSPLTT